MIVYTGGTFDLFHSGHVNLLKRCKQISGNGKVVVALNTDEFIAKFKGKPPILTYYEREAVLRSCMYVDDVVRNDFGEDSKPTILKVAPDMVAIGTDWARKDYYKQMDFTQDWLDQHNIMLCYIPYFRGPTSTVVKERVKNA